MPPVRVPLALPFTPPLDAEALLDHYARRAVPGVEHVADGTYARSLSLLHGPGLVTLRLGGPVAAAPGPPTHPAPHPPARPARPAGPDERHTIQGTLVLADPRDRAEAEAVCRTLLDLDHDPAPVRARLGEDALLGAAVIERPGRRVPGAADPTELCVRTILGQQISLAGAATAAGRLVQRFGEPLGPLAAGRVTHLFPSAGTLAAVAPDALAMPRSRARSLVGLAGALASGELVLRRGGEGASARERLLALPGIGPWSADYIVMRLLGDHDVFLAGDMGVRRALERAGRAADPRAAATLAQPWRPLRSYALHYLWSL
jgi:AraC family transcriptional regulator of adaptative response / DNA-3-methyladenine glycosylase II